MSCVPADRAPQQERSRRTVGRLLAATIWILDEVGLESATIPCIARKAEVSPATIYRRFTNKQALLRAAFLHMLKRSNQANREHASEKLGHGPLERAARALIDNFFAQFRQHYHLLRALALFMETDEDPAFVEAAQAIEKDNLNQIVQAMLAHRAEITHPDPELAFLVATLTAATTINTMAFKPRSLWHLVLEDANEALADELTRAYVAYLKSGP
jgi:AcrR family transcriptional regulator